jgi:hypothetical protein
MNTGQTPPTICAPMLLRGTILAINTACLRCRVILDQIGLGSSPIWLALGRIEGVPVLLFRLGQVQGGTRVSCPKPAAGSHLTTVPGSLILNQSVHIGTLGRGRGCGN